MSIRFNVRTNISDRIPRDAPARINAGMRGAISKSTRFGRRMTSSLTPRRRPYTYKTVKSTLIGGGPHVEGHFGSDYDVFNFLEGGTRRHPIPNAFGIRGLTVNHPGTKPYRMLDRAGPAAGQMAKGELSRVFARVFGV